LKARRTVILKAVVKQAGIGNTNREKVGHPNRRTVGKEATASFIPSEGGKGGKKDPKAVFLAAGGIKRGEGEAQPRSPNCSSRERKDASFSSLGAEILLKKSEKNEERVGFCEHHPCASLLP